MNRLNCRTRPLGGPRRPQGFLTGGPLPAEMAALMLRLMIFPAGAAEITTTLSQPSVPAGEGAELRISVENGEISDFRAPQVPGLIFQGPSTSRQMSYVNGVRSSSHTFTYAVGSMTPGDYTIPAFTLVVDGQEVRTEPKSLKVLPSSAQAPPGLPPGNSGSGQPPAAPSSGVADDDGQDIASTGFLTVEMADNNRSHAWVGEIAPVRIKAYFPDGVQARLASSLQPAGSSFTLHNISENPRQTTETRHGRDWSVVTWFAGLSATKAGTWTPDLSLKAVLNVPDQSARRQRTGDPFFDQFFARTVRKDVTLRTLADDASQLEIRSLPGEGRPDHFGGAVGKFSFGQVEIPARWQTGEPQSINAEVRGSGNFKLLDQPSLQPGEGWKVYDGQSGFTGGDAASFSGTSVFRFNAVPRRAGPQDLRLEFSYFDPDEARYKTAVSTVQPVEVTGTDLPAEVSAAPAASPETVPPPPPAAPALSLTEPVTEDTARLRLTPPAFRRSFHWFAGGCGLAVLAALTGRAFAARRADPRRRALAALQEELRQAVREASTRAAGGDIRGFFSAGRRALQLRLTSLCRRPAPAITLADVTAHLHADSPVAEFLREADLREFAPAAPDPSGLGAWRQLLDRALASLPSLPSA